MITDQKHLILVDAHVHIYPSFDLGEFLNASLSNFEYEANRHGKLKKFSAFLLLTETSRDNYFNLLKEYATIQQNKNGWSFHLSPEEISLTALHEGERRLNIVAGRQIVTEENLEVLAIGTTESFIEYCPLSDTVEKVKASGGIPIIPWGTGKWFGKRGKILAKFIDNNNDLFLGDNSGRPCFWPTPLLFKRARNEGMKILPGSDPLPFRTEYSKVGSFGFTIEAGIDLNNPAKSLKELLLRKNIPITAYGKLESPIRFFRHQIAMQIVKHRR